MKISYDALVSLCRTGDPLITDDRWEFTAEGLLIHGSAGPQEYASDMLIAIEEAGFRAWLRDPDGTDEPFHGREWAEEAFFQEYEALVHWAYSW